MLEATVSIVRHSVPVAPFLNFVSKDFGTGGFFLQFGITRVPSAAATSSAAL
jgi:hypothetical protein